MEPLSIAGSIVGLIVATLRISSLLTPIISQTREAPKNIVEIKAEVDNLRVALEKLQLLLLGRSQLLQSHTSLIRVDQVVLTLTACVSNISDLEVLLRPLKSNGSIGVLDRIGWAHKTKIVKEHLLKLQMHKSSLALILNILTCESTMNAEATVANLVAIVERLAESNKMIVNRLVSGQVDTATIPETDTLRETETIREPPLKGDNTELSHDITPAATAPAIYLGFDFDDELGVSRVYQRAAKNDDNFSMSAISSADKTASWSIFSGISLSKVSNIAAIRLPIYRGEINNPEDYEFEKAEVKESTIPKTPFAPTVRPESLDMSEHQCFVITVIPLNVSYETYWKEFTSWLGIEAGPIRRTLLEFKEGEVLLVHEIYEGGWMDATLLRSQVRGWLQMKYCILYEPEVMQSLMKAIVSHLDFVEILGITTTPGISENLNPISDIIAGVRYLLESSNCLTRDALILRDHAELRRIRKGLLSELSRLVNSSRHVQEKADALKYVASMPSSGDLWEMARVAAELNTKALRLMHKAVRFEDAYIVKLLNLPD
ncbi:hypothetical protein N431DRAFT_558801 [Stipitochalara longipes BDJ]|nr:hypothetical protein N431DRAFT_558801 [Stipitochalara longipes BDJ]